MNRDCFKCKYYDYMFDGEEEYPICQCTNDEDEPDYCPEKENT